ncbi:hypothetical protein C8Q80DRAFT_451269 [Daedaleopsis nitida]|nr:hypothetical protein C8Q80DRAFT_451269 [Daedaleopsis nitida]
MRSSRILAKGRCDASCEVIVPVCTHSEFMQLFSSIVHDAALVAPAAAEASRFFMATPTRTGQCQVSRIRWTGGSRASKQSTFRDMLQHSQSTSRILLDGGKVVKQMTGIIRTSEDLLINIPGVGIRFKVTTLTNSRGAMARSARFAVSPSVDITSKRDLAVRKDSERRRHRNPRCLSPIRSCRSHSPSPVAITLIRLVLASISPMQPTLKDSEALDRQVRRRRQCLYERLHYRLRNESQRTAAPCIRLFMIECHHCCEARSAMDAPGPSDYLTRSS